MSGDASAPVRGNPVFQDLPTTIFEVMSALAREHGAVNLGQGFPDEDGPEDVRRAAAEAVMAGPNQYPPMMGIPELRQAVAAHDARFYGLEVDWRSEVMVASGATEALADCLMGLIAPGDEVVLIEPLYDCYLPIVRAAGGVPRLVRVEPPEWTLPRAALEAAFSERTKLLVLNSPLNPAAKVFDTDELDFLAGLLERFDAYAVCDEVYEHIVFDGRRHVPLMTRPGMRGRCARVGSAGKTFSLTGWKVGYVVADAALMAAIAKAHQFVTFTTAPHLQAAVAHGLGKDDAYFRDFADGLAARRDRLAAGLRRLGFGVMDSEGSYFLIADVRPAGLSGDDVAVCRQLTVEAGVTAVPISAFYQAGEGRGGVPDHFLRFCFCKREEVIDEALARLGRFLGR